MLPYDPTFMDSPYFVGWTLKPEAPKHVVKAYKKWMKAYDEAHKVRFIEDDPEKFAIYKKKQEQNKKLI